MKTHRRRLVLFILGVLVLTYLRHYNQTTRLMAWSVVLGLGSALILTYIRGVKSWR